MSSKQIQILSRTVVDALGRDLQRVTIWHMIPFWGWFIIILVFDYRGLRAPLWRDIKIILSQWLWIVLFPWSVLGMPPLFGSAPLSETKASHQLFLNAAALTFYTVWSIVPLIISIIPGICILYHMYSLWQVQTAAMPSPLNLGPRNEKWFFVNGICNTRGIAEQNRMRLQQLFGRSVAMLYNPTQGALLDLLECISGRTFGLVCAPSVALIKELSKAIRDENVTKVVVFGHSQGAIVVSNALQVFTANDFTTEQLKKLEVYTFASPASEINTCRGLIHVEHFANTFDGVAQIGILHEALSHQPGPVFLNKVRNGHLLNEHYFLDFEKRPYTGKKGEESRLYSYITSKSK